MNDKIKFIINSKMYQVEQEDKRMLLNFLRNELHLMGTKNGCNQGHCGTCTVLINNKAKKACVTKLNKLDGAEIETIEYAESDSTLKIIQNSFVKEGAVQCGFCTPGMVLATKALLLDNKDPDREAIDKAFKSNLCRCTGYESIRRSVKISAMALRDRDTEKNNNLEITEQRDIIGQSLIREDGLIKAQGKAVYADDLYEESMLTGKLLIAEQPHGEILSLDTSEAEKIPGVEIVLTAKDLPGRNSFGITIPQQPVFCEKKVQFVGDMVAAVFADSEDAAKAGVDAIKVEYRALPVISNPDVAVKSNIFLNDAEGNLAESIRLIKGDTDKGFKEADIIIEGEYKVPFVEHAYLEPESSFAKYLDGKLTLWTPSQDSVHMQNEICACLGIDTDELRVIQSVTGGAFGGKQEPIQHMAVTLATMITKKPSKITLTRRESILMSTKRHAMTMKMRTGATRDGKLVAFESEAIADAGAYHSETRWVNFRACVAASGPYQVPNVKAEARSYYTNNPPSGAFRGFGSTQVCFASEIQMDRVARALKIDPVRIREINALKNGGETMSGQILKSGVGLPETIKAVKQRLSELENSFKASGPGKKIGIGIASSFKNVGIGLGTDDEAGAFIELMENGDLQVRTGSTEMGQGTSTIIAQIASYELQAPYDFFQVINCDTEICPSGGCTTASRQTFVTGNAVRLVSEKMERHLSEKSGLKGLKNRENLQNAYKILKEKGEDTCLTHTYFPPKTYWFNENGNHHQDGKDIPTDNFDIHYAYCFNTAAVILEVDEISGEISVLKVIEAQDAGKALNPQQVTGQIEGAVAMGLGYALCENYQVKDGYVLTDNLNKLHISKMGDIPDIEVIIVEEKHNDGPYGAKGLGEVPINPIAPAVSNAIYDAIGVNINEIPIKKEMVLSALSAKNKTEE